MNTKILTRIGLLAAFGLVLQIFSFPLPFFPEFLRYDAAELPALIAAFALGPWYGVLVDFLKNILSLFVGMAPAGIIGITANFIAGATFSLVAGTIYFTKKTKARAFIGIVLGVVLTTIVMVVANYFWLLPLWGIPKSGVLELLAISIIPFNIIKGLMTGTLTFVLYKKVKSIFEPVFKSKKKQVLNKLG
ncbi:Riboflavin transporter FmnP [Desulfonispora thiosulfatigenes DSM 11270]|uniref:Riboflavin transporter n=1 Tax=Desulfonispora thiosulfatigenes DSM 11270 TaxID=656914 RepID=A0A1W1VJ97_DESTI|nr:ECF transporter S component [Desulfonispora thiosulfatigenes]SMB93455.1 Riboflavin transporter FmnP [Desulfonispora thiosulfatigenes DSM 11270]